MTWLVVTVLVCAAMIAAALFLRSYITGAPVGAGLFGARPERRLAVIEQAAVDNRRRIILIKRDNVEHLIMTGGPVDVVIETGIGAQRVPTRPMMADAPESSVATPVFSRPARAFGQAANGPAAGGQTAGSQAAGE